MMYFTTLSVFWLAGSLILFFQKDLQKTGFLLNLALTFIMGIWSIKAFQSTTATNIVIFHLFGFENVKISIDKLSASFSFLSSSILTFSYLYRIGYLKNHSHASLKPALHLTASLWLQVVLTGLCMFNHATFLLCLELFVLSSFILALLLLVVGFNWLSSYSHAFSLQTLLTSLSHTAKPATASRM